MCTILARGNKHLYMPRSRDKGESVKKREVDLWMGSGDNFAQFWRDGSNLVLSYTRKPSTDHFWNDKPPLRSLLKISFK